MKLSKTLFFIFTIFISFEINASERKITEIQTSSNTGYGYNQKFTYSDNKLIKYTFTYENGKEEFDVDIIYSDDKVTVEGIIDGRICKQTFILNNAGYASRCKSEYFSYEDYELYAEQETIFEIDEQGYLIKVMETKTYFNDSNDSNYLYSFNYQNGNLIEAEEVCLDYSDYYKYHYTISYNDKENKGGLINIAQEEYLFDYLPALYINILGKPSKNLQSSIKEWKENSDFEKKYEVVYFLDENGYVTKSIMNQDKENYTSTYIYENPVSSIDPFKENYSIQTYEDKIVIKNLLGIEPIEVYSISGILIKKELNSIGNMEIRLPNKGIFLIRITNKVYKVTIH